MHSTLLRCALALSVSTALPAFAAADTFALGDGHSGAFTSSATNQVINAYAPVTAASGTSVTIGATTGTGTFTAGDLVLLWQVAGLTGLTSGSATSIDVSASTTVAHYEFARVQSVAAGSLTLTSALLTTFAAPTQVIRVPEYTTVSVAMGNSLTAPAWNGSVGGAVVFLATGAVTVNGSVDVSGRGFRPGLAPTQDGSTNCLGDDGTPPQYGQKGEGLQGTSFGANFGGKGNVGNAGGGGNCHNAGGGGGGHAAPGGQGGGRWSDNADFGGRGGVKVIGSLNQLTFGGGGGAGHVNQSTGGNGAGAAGGGVILVRALSVGGTGSWLAKGNDAIDNPEPCDPGGGGGAGGLIQLRSATTLACGSASVNGGKGGSHGSCSSNPYTTQAQGVGGGGAAGYTYLQAASATCTPSAVGGAQGTSAGNVSMFAQPGGNGTPGSTPGGGFAVAQVTAPTNGSVTANQRPTLTATGTAGFTMFIFVDGTQVCSGNVSAGGTFSCTPSSDLTYAAHGVTAQVSSTGNLADATPMSPQVNFTVAPVPAVTLDAVTPINASNASNYTVAGSCVTGAGPVTIVVAPVSVGPLTCTAGRFTFTLNLAMIPDGAVTVAASQTNAHGTFGDSKNTTKDTVILAPVIGAPLEGATVAAATGVISGTSEAQASITVFNGMTPICTVTASTMGVWACPAGLSAGTYAVSAVQRDVAGNVSVPSTTVNFTAIDAPLVSITTAPSINAANASVYTVGGACSSTATVAVSVGTVSTVAMCSAGVWSATVDVSALADAAAVTVTAAVSNVAGMNSATKPVLKDTLVSAPVISAPTAGSTIARNPTISGTAEPSATVTVTEGTSTVCTATADAMTGAWSCASTLAPGGHSITARQTDPAGNISTASPAVDFTIAPPPSITLSNVSVINAANVAAVPISGSCTTAAGTVSVTLGSISTTAPCTAGTFTVNVDASMLADASLIAVTASQTSVGGTATDTKNTRKDTVALVPVLTAPGNGDTVNPMPTLTGTGEIGATVTVKEGSATVCTAVVNASGQWTCAATFTTGAHSVTVSQVDTAGNASPVSTATPFTVINTPAVILDTPAAINVANAAAYPVAGQCVTGSGAVTVSVGSLMTTVTCTAGRFTTTLDVHTLADGTGLTVTASQANAAGTGSDSKTTIKDTQIATPVISTPLASATVGTAVMFTGTAEPGAAVSVKEGTTTVCTAQASPAGTWNCAATLALGAHQVTATQTDTAGNVSTPSADRPFAVAATPSVTLDMPAIINAARASSYPVAGQCDSTAGVVSITVGTVSTTTPCTSGRFSTMLDVSALNDSSGVVVSASQTNGVGTGSDSKNTSKDTVAAPPTFTSPTPGSMVSSPTTITGTAEPLATIEVKDGTTTVCTATANAQGVFTCTGTLPTGAHTLTATQTDPSGNTSPASSGLTFTVATGVLPVVTIMGNAINAANASAWPVRGSCTTADGQVTVTVGSVSSTTPCTNGMYLATLDVSSLADGPSLTARATQTNASGTGEATVVVAKDTIAPSTPVITSPAAGANVTDIDTITGTAEPNSQVTVTLDGMVIGSTSTDSQGRWSLSPGVSVTPGLHTLSAVSTDTAGNKSAPSADQQFTVVSTRVVITSPADQSSVAANEALTVTGTGPAGGTVTLSLNGTAVSTVKVNSGGQWAAEVPAASVTAGDHVLTARASGGIESAPVRVTATAVPLNTRYAGAGLSCQSAAGGWSFAPLMLVALWLLRRRSA